MKKTSGEATELLLKNIAQRLAGRPDCKDVNYVVTINHTGVSMQPIIDVYPNRYKRHEADKLDIVSFVHSYKMPNTKLEDFVFGTYRYESTFDKTKRRWVRIS